MPPPQLSRTDPNDPRSRPPSQEEVRSPVIFHDDGGTRPIDEQSRNQLAGEAERLRREQARDETDGRTGQMNLFLAGIRRASAMSMVRRPTSSVYLGENALAGKAVAGTGGDESDYEDEPIPSSEEQTCSETEEQSDVQRGQTSARKSADSRANTTPRESTVESVIGEYANLHLPPTPVDPLHPEPARLEPPRPAPPRPSGEPKDSFLAEVDERPNSGPAKNAAHYSVAELERFSAVPMPKGLTSRRDADSVLAPAPLDLRKRRASSSRGSTSRSHTSVSQQATSSPKRASLRRSDGTAHRVTTPGSTTSAKSRLQSTEMAVSPYAATSASRDSVPLSERDLSPRAVIEIKGSASGFKNVQTPQSTASGKRSSRQLPQPPTFGTRMVSAQIAAQIAAVFGAAISTKPTEDLWAEMLNNGQKPRDRSQDRATVVRWCRGRILGERRHVCVSWQAGHSLKDGV